MSLYGYADENSWLPALRPEQPGMLQTPTGVFTVTDNWKLITGSLLQPAQFFH